MYIDEKGNFVKGLTRAQIAKFNNDRPADFERLWTNFVRVREQLYWDSKAAGCGADIKGEPFSDDPVGEQPKLGIKFDKAINGDGRKQQQEDRKREMAPKGYVIIDPTTRPPRQWIYGRHYIRKFISATVTPGGVGKTDLALVEALSMATGRDLLDNGSIITMRRVWYMNGEDPREEIERRLDAIRLEYRISEDDLKGIDDRLFITSSDTPFIIATKEKDRIRTTADVDIIRDNIIAQKIDVLIVDPFVSFHSVPENDNGAIDRVIKTLSGIADMANCAVEIIHHARKPSGADYTVDDSRGASAPINAARVSRVLNVMSNEEAAKCDIKPERRSLYFRVDDGSKQNLRPCEDARWMQHVSVSLNNSTDEDPADNIGVVRPYAIPKASEGLSLYDKQQLLIKVSESEYRENPKAKDWVGNLIADYLDINLQLEAGVDDEKIIEAKKRDQAKVVRIIRELIADGIFVVDEHKDQHGEMKKFIVAGKMPEAPQSREIMTPRLVRDGVFWKTVAKNEPTKTLKLAARLRE